MRACFASSARDFNSQPSSDTSGAVKASEMIIALKKEVSLRNGRTPGAQGTVVRADTASGRFPARARGHGACVDGDAHCRLQ